ncbi:MAG: hypothetical protein IPJ88_09780 [Myxococcales bacterium]|nr:MAG: hypothetical protein IPJ88_09780 [Myxococcales bacterium]
MLVFMVVLLMKRGAYESCSKGQARDLTIVVFLLHLRLGNEKTGLTPFGEVACDLHRRLYNNVYIQTGYGPVFPFC